MKFERNKILSLIFLTIMLASTAFAATIPSAAAQTSSSASYCFIIVNPNPIGVSQTLQVNLIMWIPPPTAVALAGDRWQGLTVTITSPDGTIENRGPLKSDAVGSAFFTYVPTTIGTYKFQLHFPGQHIVGLNQAVFGPPTPIDIQYKPSDSNIETLIVQQQPVTSLQLPPLPTNYWTRPINAQNQAWTSVSSNWLMAGWSSTSRQFDQGYVYNPTATAPSSAHVLWTQPLTFGGQIGGEYGTTAFHNGMSYEQFFKPPVIISGRLYFNTIQAEEPTAPSAPFNFNNETISTITAMDLATGKTLFTIPSASLSFGQIYNFVSPNQGGGFAYLWDTSGGTTWKMYDAWTGNYILSIANVSAGTTLLDNTFNVNRGPGDILVYNLDPVAGTLSLWNSTQVFQTYEATNYPGDNPLNNVQTWRIYNWQGMTIDGNKGTMWTKKLDSYPTGGGITQVGYDNTVYVSAGQVVGALGATAAFSFPQKSTWVGYSMNDGSKLWGPNVLDATSKIPANGTTFAGFSQPQTVGIEADRGFFPLFVKDTLQWYAWNVTSGQFLWGPTPAYTSPWGLFNYEDQIAVKGILYNTGYDGLIHAFSTKDGTPLWTFSSGNAGTLTPYGTWPFYNGITIVNNAVIATTGDHGNGAQPLYEGEGIYLVNPTSGQQLWNMTGWFCQPVLADGIMVSQNLYDNQIYAFGKGPSAVTVTAPTTSIQQGSSIIIQGSITDQSTGKPNTPAISDADQAQWMNYLYEQQPMPNHATGVQVTLVATDSSGNHKTIGTTTSDALGHYDIAWNPPSQGKYVIAAEFMGTNSYWPSTAETSIIVGNVPNPSISPSISTAPSPGGIPISDLYLIIAAIVIIVIIAVAAVVLRRRK